MLRDLEILKIDYTAADATYRVTETHKVADLNGRILIPYEGPIYARNLVVRADGAPLTIETDYTLEDDFTELELMTGKKVIGSLRFSTRIATDYKEIKIAYQKVGEFIISRKFLLDAIETILDNDKPIDWLTQVFGKPDTYPPAAHNHNIKNSDEIVGFHDLMIIFKQASGDTKKHGLDLWVELKAIEEKAYKTLNDSYTTLWNKMFSHIMNMNVPHPMTKEDLGLGQHPNYGTATKEEDMEAAFHEYDEKDALRNDVISTPLGVRAAIDNYEIDTDGFIRQGSLPFSYYGSGFYIPPPISGSFEGLGTNMGGNALCLESNGWTVVLTRGFDSKVRKLYYYYNRNIYDKNETFVFSGYPYISQLMENNGHEPNHIISGSSGRILVIGDHEANQYYIALGNGTLDADSHQLKKINMDAFKDTTIGGTMWNPDQAYVMMIGDYVYIITAKSGWTPEVPDTERFGSSTYRATSFYRINITELSDSSVSEVNFVRQTMTYQDSEGEWNYNRQYVNIPKCVIEYDDEGNKVLKRLVFDFRKPPSNARLGDPWRCQWFNMENPDNKNQAAIRMFHNVRWQYSATSSNAGDWYFCIPMFFNTLTNTLTLDDRFFSISRDPESGADTIAPEGTDANSWYNGAISPYVSRHGEVAAAWIPKLGYVSCGTSTKLLPYTVTISFMGFNPNESDSKPKLSDWEIFNQDLILLNKNGYKTTNIPLESPFGFTSKPAFQRDLWYYNDTNHTLPVEIFQAANKNGNTTMWYRETQDSYEYAERDAYKFKYISSNIIGRVPSTKFGKVYFGNFAHTAGKKIAVVNTSLKNKYSVQYGMVNILSRNYKPEQTSHALYGGLYYSTAEAPVKNSTANIDNNPNNDLYVTLLGKHTLNTETEELQVDRILSESVVVPQAQWMGLIKTMLGDNFSDISSEVGGNGKDGEWVVTFYISAQEGSGTNIIPSVALLYWHRFSDPKNTYAVYCTFNWKTVSTKTTGERVIQLTNIVFPDDVYGPATTKVVSTRFSYTVKGQWFANSDYSHESCVPEIHIDFTDTNNYHFWITSGVSMDIPLNAEGVHLRYRIVDGVRDTSNVAVSALYNAGNYVSHRLYVTDLGITTPITPNASGGAALYVQGGEIPTGTVAILQAVFVEGNWTLFINSDMTAIFNGSEKNIVKTNYDLSQLGIEYKNKTFYLYAVSGKAQGYYDLSLSERTASPYHLLVATIKTNAFGIETIDVEQSFAISGFTISTVNRGGAIPATTGTFPETGEFEAIVKEDLFDASQYN